MGNVCKKLKINGSGVCGCTGDDQLGLLALGDLGDVVIVDVLVLGAHGVGHRLEPLARLVGRAAVGQVAARRQIHAHEGVARLQQRHEHRLVGLGARVRLDVGEAGLEQLLGPLDGQVLDDVDIFAAAIVATARIALGVLVGQDRTLGLQHGARDDVLGRDQLDLVLLPLQFVLHGVEDRRIGALEARGEERVMRDGGAGLVNGHQGLRGSGERWASVYSPARADQPSQCGCDGTLNGFTRSPPSRTSGAPMRRPRTKRLRSLEHSA